MWRRSSDLAHPFLGADFQDREAVAIAEVYLPNAETWVAVVDARLVGFLALIGDEVGALFVEPADHGRGLGRALMDHARRLRRRLTVQVFEENALGRRFYARYGFEVVGRSVHEPSGHRLLGLALEPETRARGRVRGGEAGLPRCARPDSGSSLQPGDPGAGTGGP